MYNLNPKTKEKIQETLFEAGLLLSSIPEELLTTEMWEKVQDTIHNCLYDYQFLNTLKEVEEIDIREFHQMD